MTIGSGLAVGACWLPLSILLMSTIFGVQWENIGHAIVILSIAAVSGTGSVAIYVRD